MEELVPVSPFRSIKGRSRPRSAVSGKFVEATKPRRGRPRIMGPKPPLVKRQPVPPSLPPVVLDETALVSLPILTPDTKPDWWLPPNSKVRAISLHIIAMRLAGMEDSEIAAALNISQKSISPYIYRAGKNGWLDLDNAADRIEYQLLHKVVRNLDEGLDSKDTLKTGMKARTEVALKMAEGTVFKKFSEATAPQTTQTVVAVKIEMPAGPVQQMREETVGGVPAHIIDVKRP